MSERNAADTAQLEIRAGQEADTYYLRLIGELDLSGREATEAALLQAEESQAETILLDLDGLWFIDSTGLKLLLDAKRRDEESGRLRMTRGSGHVAELLRLTGLARALPFV